MCKLTRGDLYEFIFDTSDHFKEILKEELVFGKYFFVI